MRASKNIDDKDLHIGGAEKIIDESELLNVVNKLTLRGLNHSRGDADFINLKINKVFEEDIIKVKALKTRTIDVKDSNEGLSVVPVSYTHLTLPTT